MAFTAKLGEALSWLSNILLGKGAVIHPVASSATITAGVPSLTSVSAYTAPRYPKVQTAPQASSGAASTATSFSTLPSAGNLIIVFGSSGKDPNAIACADNQGNTYHLAVKSSSAFTGPCAIFYAYNIGAPVGTFTVTISDPGAGSTSVAAVEYSG